MEIIRGSFLYYTNCQECRLNKQATEVFGSNEGEKMVEIKGEEEKGKTPFLPPLLLTRLFT